MNIDLDDKDFIQDPYPVLENLRKNHPIFSYDEHTFIITGYSECVELLKKDEIGFLENNNRSSDSWFKLLSKNDLQSWTTLIQKCKSFNLDTLAFKNPPEHTRLKKLFLKSFRKTAVEELDIEIEKICNQLIEKLKTKNEFDLIEDFCTPFSNNIILYIMGYKGEDGDYLRGLSNGLLDSMKLTVTKEEKKIGIESKINWAKKIQQIFDNPALISNDGLLNLLRNKLIEQEITEDEFVANSALLIMAGQETTQGYIASCIYHFLKNNIPLTQDNIKKGMQEALRFEPPNLYITKFVRENFEYNNQKFLKGNKIHFFISAANRDVNFFKNPHDFILDRDNEFTHISFGSGVHYCIGSFLALKETEIALKKLFKNFPNLKLKDDKVFWKDSIRIRCLEKLNLIYDSGESNKKIH